MLLPYHKFRQIATFVSSHARRAQQCRARKMSAAVPSSHAPHGSKARLIVVPNRRDSWRSHVHRTRFGKHCSSSSYRPAMSGVEGQDPSSFSRGFKGDTLFREREYPPYCAPCGTQGTKCRAPRCQKSRLSAKKKERLGRGVLLIFAKVKFTDTSACRRWQGRGRRRRRW